MKNKITYLNCVLTVIAVALTVIVLQNAKIIQPTKASQQFEDVLDVNVCRIGNVPVFGNIPVVIKEERRW